MDEESGDGLFCNEQQVRWEHRGVRRVALIELCQLSLPSSDAPLNSPAKAAAVAAEVIGKSDRERFAVLHLDVRHHLLSAEVASTGILTCSLVHPREVFKAAFLANAAGIICAHNHPSGHAYPSPEDKKVLRRLEQAGGVLGVPLVDFLILGGGQEHWSAREQGELPRPG